MLLLNQIQRGPGDVLGNLLIEMPFGCPEPVENRGRVHFFLPEALSEFFIRRYEHRMNPSVPV